MTGTQTFEARTALGLAAAVATLAAVRFRPAFRATARDFDRVYLAVFASTRLLLFAVTFLVLRLPVRGDLPSYYLQEAWWRLAGGVPYRTFPSSYAPLSSFLYAAVYSIHRSPLTLVLFAIVAEIAAAWVWLRVLDGVAPEHTARTAALLCLFHPISLQYVTIDGQNNVLISLFLALAFLALLRGRPATSGALIGASIAVVKFLPLLFTPAFVLYARRQGFAWAVACSTVILLVYGYFLLALRAPVFDVFSREGDLKTAGGLPYLVESISGRDFHLKLWDRLLLLVLAALVVRVAVLAWRASSLSSAAQTIATQTIAAQTRGTQTRATQTRATLFSLGAFLLALMALAKKTWPTYSLMLLFPLALAVAATAARPRGWLQRSAIALFAVFGVLSVTVHSFWASILNQAPFSELHASLRAGQLSAWVLLLLEVALSAAYAWLALVCIREEAACTGQKEAPAPFFG